MKKKGYFKLYLPSKDILQKTQLNGRIKAAVVSEMAVAIKDISEKHNLTTSTVIKILPELSEIILEGSKIDYSVDWIE